MYSTKALTITQKEDGILIKYNDDTTLYYLLDFLAIRHIPHKHTTNTIHITCESSVSLIEFHKKFKHIVPHEAVCAVYRDLSHQLLYLHKKGFALDHLYRKDTIVIDDTFFIYVGAHHIVKETTSQQAYPDTLYQLGVLIIKLHFNKDVTKEKYILKKVIEPLYYTPLHGSLLRCMDNVPENRALVYI
jgi:hypothetical protein|tara:strand:- start:4100 stop:4663 length:564 start_codon:yes stop_codon:yes gene_type:complete